MAQESPSLRAAFEIAGEDWSKALIDPKQLLADLQKLLKRLEPDIRGRCESNPDIDVRLRAEYDNARAANRTAQAFEVWREDYITQVAVAWILACVFVRFLEDNGLIDTAWLAGPCDRLQLARDQHTLYFQNHPTHSDREYLQHVFQEVAKLPSMRELLDGSHNPISKLGPTGDAARELLEFWQKVAPTTGVITHDFTDPEWNTRFLGDLYQDLSESAQDRYALLQTPEFVEEFILSRTLLPAVEEFGYSTVKMIDPACGSGHFLLGGFQLLLDLRMRNEPGITVRAQVEAALGQVFGVDLNPFAVSIARFRLLVAALRACRSPKLAGAPGFQINVAAGDSLLHGPSPKGLVGVQRALEDDPLQHHYDVEDAAQVSEFLSQQYHVVVGNPPYITVKDQGLNQVYRTRFQSCHGKYSLAVPFKERFFALAVRPEVSEISPAGFVGMITASSFMKREFGKKLVEEFIPRWDLTHVVDTAGAYIPGHGTPTVILIGRHRRPVKTTVRTVMSIQGEPGTPADPATGKVWSAILRQIDQPGSQSSFINVIDAPRTMFARHPWSIGGGGAAELKLRLDELAAQKLSHLITSIGFMAITGEDDYFTGPDYWLNSKPSQKTFATGDNIRDWHVSVGGSVFFPYGGGPDWAAQSLSLTSPTYRELWPYRTSLKCRSMFGKSPEQHGFFWYEYMQFIRDRISAQLLIPFASVATHNHFVLNRGGIVFTQSAPVIKLRTGASFDDHLSLVGLLNSSTACFWIKQVAHNKGSTVDQRGARQRTAPFEDFYDYDGTKLKQFPVSAQKPLELPKELDRLAMQFANCRPAAWLGSAGQIGNALALSRQQSADLLGRMVSIAEELDWQCYRLYGLTEEDLTTTAGAAPPIQVGERAFEIVMARKMRDGELATTWFERHGAKPITELPSAWSDGYRHGVERRIAEIASNNAIALIEQPEYKRRWNSEKWEDVEHEALRQWMLARICDARYWPTYELRSCANLADAVRSDAAFQEIAEFYRGRQDFDWTSLIVELVSSNGVPFLPVLRYSDSGRQKREIWKRTWELQRKEDRIEADVQADSAIPPELKPDVQAQRKRAEIGDICVPPRYEGKDFSSPLFWSVRGRLDIPKERFVTFPGCERDADPTLVIAWAGWDYLQLAQAVAAYYERVKNYEGWTPERRVPLLTAIFELLPWLRQWHNDIHPDYHERMGDFFQQFVEDESRAMEMTVEDIGAWTPPARSGIRARNRKRT